MEGHGVKTDSGERSRVVSLGAYVLGAQWPKSEEASRVLWSGPFDVLKCSYSGEEGGEEGQSFGEFTPMKRCQFSMRTGSFCLLRALSLADWQANKVRGHSQGSCWLILRPSPLGPNRRGSAASLAVVLRRLTRCR